MKKFIAAIIILFIAADLTSADLKGYRDTPLLSLKVEGNRLPFGEYMLVRSYRNITQLLISVNTKIILYTDRDNMKDSEIFVSAYSRIEEVIISVPSIQQHEFNLAVKKLISEGDSSTSSTIPFPGGEKFFKDIKKGVKPERNEGEYFIFYNTDNRPVSLLTFNLLARKLTLRNLMDKKNVPWTFYNIYIDDSYDRNIINLIREYTAAIKKINTILQ